MLKQVMLLSTGDVERSETPLKKQRKAVFSCKRQWLHWSDFWYCTG